MINKKYMDYISGIEPVDTIEIFQRLTFYTYSFYFLQEKSFIASYYRQHFAEIQIKDYKIKTSFVRPEGLKAWNNKTIIDFMILILIFVENCL